jgi:cytoskeletal protein CcmA (bactofilin family)
MPFWTKQDKQPDPWESLSAPATEPKPEREEPKPMAVTNKQDYQTSPAAVSGDLLLGQGAEFEGKLTFAGTVRIDAKFKGSIITDDVLVVGEHARIEADITCGTVIIHGEVNGDIVAKTAVELRHPGKVRGNVETPSLVVEKGVVFNGEARMDRGDRTTSRKPAATAGASAVAP